MSVRSGVKYFIAIAILLGCNNSAFSQATTSFAQLNGIVYDPEGAVVAKAAIELRHLGTNRLYTATTSDTGYYLIPTLQPGRYELTVTYSGFAKYTQTEIVLNVGQTATINVTLRVTVQESIAVTGEAAAR
jgi:Carboxypeptidase regulatory-like domain